MPEVYYNQMSRDISYLETKSEEHPASALLGCQWSTATYGKCATIEVHTRTFNSFT